MKPGRQSGYTPSNSTKQKIRESKLGIKRNSETKRKISNSLSGIPKTIIHRENISNSLTDLETKCLRRFEELKLDYPDHVEFFETNKSDLLFAMRDCRSEQELTDLRRYVEVAQLESSTGYVYSSSSMYAAEDNVIALLDVKRLLERVVNPITSH